MVMANRWGSIQGSGSTQIYHLMWESLNGFVCSKCLDTGQFTTTNQGMENEGIGCKADVRDNNRLVASWLIIRKKWLTEVVTSDEIN